jgi:hypothetical protein
VRAFLFFILAERAGSRWVRGVTRVVMGGYGRVYGGHNMGEGKKNLILSKVGKNEYDTLHDYGKRKHS